MCLGFFCVFFWCTFTFALGPSNGWTRNDVSLDIVCLFFCWRLRRKNVQLSLPDKLLSVDEYALFTWWLRHNSEERSSLSRTNVVLTRWKKWHDGIRKGSTVRFSEDRGNVKKQIPKWKVRSIFHSQTGLGFSKRDRTERTQEISTRKRKSPIHFDWDRWMDDDQMTEFS